MFRLGKLTKFLALPTLVLAAALIYHAPSALAASVQVNGQVTDSSQNAVPGVVVTIYDSGTTTVAGQATTDNSGNYDTSIDDSNATYDLTFAPPAASGDQMFSLDDQTITSDTTINAVLLPAPPPPPPTYSFSGTITGGPYHVYGTDVSQSLVQGGSFGPITAAQGSVVSFVYDNQTGVGAVTYPSFSFTLDQNYPNLNLSYQTSAVNPVTINLTTPSGQPAGSNFEYLGTATATLVSDPGNPASLQMSGGVFEFGTGGTDPTTGQDTIGVPDGTYNALFTPSYGGATQVSTSFTVSGATTVNVTTNENLPPATFSFSGSIAGPGPYHVYGTDVSQSIIQSGTFGPITAAQGSVVSIVYDNQTGVGAVTFPSYTFTLDQNYSNLDLNFVTGATSPVTINLTTPSGQPAGSSFQYLGTASATLVSDPNNPATLQMSGSVFENGTGGTDPTTGQGLLYLPNGGYSAFITPSYAGATSVSASFSVNGATIVNITTNENLPPATYSFAGIIGAGLYHVYGTDVSQTFINGGSFGPITAAQGSVVSIVYDNQTGVAALTSPSFTFTLDQDYLNLSLLWQTAPTYTATFVYQDAVGNQFQAPLGGWIGVANASPVANPNNPSSLQMSGGVGLVDYNGGGEIAQGTISLPAGSYTVVVLPLTPGSGQTFDESINLTNNTTFVFQYQIPAPTGLTAPSPTITAPSLTWNAVAGASSYIVYRDGAQIGTSGTTSYIDSQLATAGTYTYTVAAVMPNDAVSGQSEGVMVTFNVGQPPHITSPTSVVTIAGGTVSASVYTLTATGSPSPQLSESGTLPTGLTFVDNGNGTGYFAGTISPTAAAQNYLITLSAANVAGATSQQFTLTVVEPLVIQVPANIIVPATDTTGAVVTYSVTTTGGYGAITISCTDPSGTEFATGTTTVVCTATDSLGESASASFTITVQSAQTQAQDLLTYITQNNIGPGGSLEAKLQTVINDLQATPVNDPAVEAAIAKFEKEVNNDAGKQITDAEATDLLGSADDILAAIGD